jgi:hypothetical protein
VARANTLSVSPLLGLMLHQRVVIVTAFAGITAPCWLDFFLAAADMSAMGDMAMPMPMK